MNRQVLVRLAIATAAILVAVTGSSAAAQPLSWGPCPNAENINPRQQCASLTVPLDYAAPTGRQIEIAVSRIPAEAPERRRGVLLANPGGPGESGIYEPHDLAAALPKEVRQQYDLIGFDPRGINFSAPVTCDMTSEDMDVLRLIPYPDVDGNIAENVAYSARIAAGCAGASTADLLPHITTANTAQDMDRLRVALGEQRISYLGYSYGTYLGAVYAELFPQRTDRFVLDSVVHPRRIWRDMFASWGPGAEVAFPGFAEFAAKNHATYGLGATPEAVRDKFFELLREIEREPYLYPGLVIDHRLFRELLRRGLRSDPGFPNLATVWQMIDQRELSPAKTKRALAAVRALRDAALPDRRGARDAAAAGFPTPPDDNAYTGLWAVACGDADWPESPATYQQDVLIADRQFPLIGRAASNIWPCAFWPFDPRDQPVSVGRMNGGNALLVQSLRDPATPLDGAVAMRETLGSRSRLVTAENGGHAVSFGLGNSCVDAAAARFLVSGTLPASDTYCPRDPSPRRVGARRGD